MRIESPISILLRAFRAGLIMLIMMLILSAGILYQLTW